MSQVFPKISLIEQVKNLLKEEIANGSLLPGQRIESVRSLLKKYKVSHTTAAAALKQLKEEGWINSQVGSGAFVSAAPPIFEFKATSSTGNIIYFIILSDSELEGYHSKVLNYLQELVVEYDLQLKFVSVDDAEALERIAASPSTLGIISQAEIKQFSSNVPVVSYGMSPPVTDSCFMQPDNFQGGLLSGNILLENGHSNIYYVSGDFVAAPGRLHFNQRYNGLCAACEMSKITHPGLIRWHIKNPKSRQQVTELLKQIKNKAPEAPTALVIGNKAMATEIYMIAIGMGMQIPEDLSIITFIDRAKNRDNHISTIDFSRKAMAQQILNILINYREPKIPIDTNKHLLPMFLSNTDTIKNLKHNHK